MTRATKPLRHQKKASSKRSAWRQPPSDMSEQAARRSAAGCEIEGVTLRNAEDGGPRGGSTVVGRLSRWATARCAREPGWCSCRISPVPRAAGSTRSTSPPASNYSKSVQTSAPVRPAAIYPLNVLWKTRVGTPTLGLNHPGLGRVVVTSEGRQYEVVPVEEIPLALKAAVEGSVQTPRRRADP